MTLAAALLLLGASVTISQRRLRGVQVNPLVLFTGVWFAALLLYQVNAVFDLDIFLQERLSLWASLLTVLSLSAYCVGGILVVVRVRQTSPFTDRLKNEAWLRKLWQATSLLLAVFSVAVAYRLAVVTGRYGGVSLGRIRAGLAEGFDTIPLYVSIPALAGLIVASNLGILLVTSRWRQAGVMSAGVLALGWLYDLLTATRGMAFYTVTSLAGTAAVAFVVTRGPLRLRHYLLGLLAGCLLLTLLTLSVFLRSDRVDSFKTRLVFDNYVYVSGNIAALQYFVRHPLPSRLPAHYTFGAGYRILNFASRGLVERGFLREDDYGKHHARILTLQIDLPNMPFNSAPFIAYYYADFGFFGAVLAAFIAGVLVTWIYARAIVLRHPLAIQASALAMTSVALSFRDAFLSDPSMWLAIGGLAVQYAFLQGRAEG